MATLQAAILYFSLFTSLFFEVFMLITYFEVRDEIKFEAAHGGEGVTHFPSTTIIVPSYNEEQTIAKTIRSILALDYPKDKLSLILVDDGSTDGTAWELDKFKNHPQVRILTKENGGKHTALNYALEHVDTELVGCLDADSFVNEDALRRIVPYFDDATIMAVTPSIKIHDPQTILQYVQKVEYSWGIFLRRILSSIGALYVTPGPFSIFRVTVFKELGGYRAAHHTEDLELALRMQKNRYKIANSHGAHVYTVAPAHLPELVKQRVRWTYGFLNNAMDYRDMYFNKRYGSIGLFILPIATTSIFTTLFGTGTALTGFFSRITTTITKYRTVGFQPVHISFSFDWFFLNTTVISFLTITALLLTFVILFLSLKITEGRFKFGKEIIYYLVLYIFIVPIWLTKALWNTVWGKKVSWR